MPKLSENKAAQVSAIILAGGKSSRMGRDKALLQFGDETLLERLVRVVDPLVARLVIVLSQTLNLPHGLKFNSQKTSIGRDTLKEQGPLQGIADAYALLPAAAQFIFVVSCDLPFISRRWLHKLLKEIRQNDELDAVCSQQDGIINPLVSIYRKRTLGKAQTLLNQGKRSCQALLDDNNILPIEPSADEKILISNINTPEDYYQALQKLENKIFI
jgi:molybdopterin-guanine dinucleotide biosynthesis protein A